MRVVERTDPSAAVATHATAIATLRAFALRAQAGRAVVLIDRGEERGALMIEWEDGALALTDGDVTWTLAPDAAADVTPLALPELRPPPASAIHVHSDAGELHAPIGAIENLADALLALAGALGGRSVASAEWATDDPDTPLMLAARPGEPLVVALGEDQFELPLS